jgi:hypothetical protein
VLADTLLRADDPDVTANVAWCFADFAQLRPRQVLEMGCASRLLEHVLHPRLTVRGAALRCVCLLAQADGLAARVLVGKGLFHVLGATLRLPLVETRMDASWILCVLASVPEFARMLITANASTLVAMFALVQGARVVFWEVPTNFFPSRRRNHRC